VLGLRAPEAINVQRSKTLHEYNGQTFMAGMILRLGCLERIQDERDNQEDILQG